MPSTADTIRTHALALGFDEVSIAPARPLATGAAYRAWLDEGRHADMGYLDRHHALRVDPSVLEPGTQTVVTVLKNYYLPSDRCDGGLRIARYAHGDDYHDDLRDRLRALAHALSDALGREVSARPAVDSAPLLERDLAQSTGLGWVGKNSMLIHPSLGSFCFIAELLLDVHVDAPAPVVVPDRCGRCSACMDACPTGCIVSPKVIDARRCIAYLTIENRGPIPASLRPMVRDFLFGCDLCQDVCPWNTKAGVTQDARRQTRARYHELSVQDVLCMDQATYSATFSKSAIKRAKRRGLLRNAAVVLGNTGTPEDVELLCERLHQEPDPLVRGHIAWALGRIPDPQGVQALQQQLQIEQDDFARQEILDALSQPGLQR